MIVKSKKYKLRYFNKDGFTLIEMSVALVIIGMIVAGVFVVINRAVETIGDWQMKMEAFEIARENMEKLLAQKSLSDMVEYGTSETNPDIEWETTVESFYEPVSNNMWMRAICVSEYTDSKGEEQKIELTHWLTGLSKKQIMQILEQQQREDEYAESMNEELPDETQPDEQEDQSENPQEPLPEDQSSEDEYDYEDEYRKAFGPPPEGYSNWKSVPEDIFWKNVMKKLK
ncbi:MAG: hypothetical protein BWY69_01814 [Planctomycetes bacterium ADurb.Bin401]|nr:MAG: hypothetical protein BWY69_01814 [Planctomycetes bacterium ADurb.Bin401]